MSITEGANSVTLTSIRILALYAFILAYINSTSSYNDTSASNVQGAGTAFDLAAAETGMWHDKVLVDTVYCFQSMEAPGFVTSRNDERFFLHEYHNQFK